MNDIELIFLVVLWVVCLHECLHILGFLILRMRYRVSIIYKWHLPIAISLDNDEFSGDFWKMGRAMRSRYAFVAVMPYVVIFPLFLYLAGFGEVMRLISLTVIGMHAPNLILEFVDIRKALHLPGMSFAG